MRTRWLPLLLQGWLLALFLLHFVAIKIGAVPRWTYTAVDVFSLLVTVVLLVYWREWYARVPKIWLCLLVSGVLMALASCLVNAVDPWVGLSGFRRYFRFLPFAVLPWLWGVMNVSWQRQSGLLLFLLLLQVPLALHERWNVPLVIAPGDHVVGTLSSPAFLTITMLCAISVLAALWLHARISAVLAFGLMSVLFVPCTLNESKSVLILLPIAALLPWLVSVVQVPVRRGMALFIWMLCAFAVFFPVYDHFNYGRWGYTLWDFVFEQQRTVSYLSNDFNESLPFVHMSAAEQSQSRTAIAVDDAAAKPVADEPVVASSVPAWSGSKQARYQQRIKQARHQGLMGAKKPGKFDSIRFAAVGVGKMPLRGALGAGLGNASLSRFEFSEGALAKDIEHQRPDSTAISLLLWECGFVGVVWVLLLGLYLLWQVLRLVWRPGRYRVAGSAAAGVLTLVGVSLLYKNLMDSAAIWGLFWYLAGWLVLLANTDAPGEQGSAA
jgi:hypothetical protein